jgi:hypothetical protein
VPFSDQIRGTYWVRLVHGERKGFASLFFLESIVRPKAGMICKYSELELDRC